MKVQDRREIVEDLHGSDVLVVDDAPENLRLLCTMLERGGLVPRPVTSGAQALEAATADPPDIVLMDMLMPGLSGVEVCRELKKDPRLGGIPVIFISGLHGTADKVEAFRAGAVDYVSKPLQEQEILARVRTHLQLRRLQLALEAHNQQLELRVATQVKEITASQRATIFALAKLAETRDDDTGQHIERVQRYTQLLADGMRERGHYPDQLTDPFIDDLVQTASLHDIGKVGIPDAILRKPGQLTVEEYAEIKKHSILGADTLARVLERHPDNQFLRIGVEVARSHHEQWDGSGYPDGLAGQAIPLSARIVALADVYDALTSCRCYRVALSHEVARERIRAGRGTHFEPAIAQAFEASEATFDRIRGRLRDG
jgi:putative two-component system response regulator